RELLEAAMPLPPTLLVDSGHGLQPWWLLNELWLFGSEQERREAEALSKEFQFTLIHYAQQQGFEIEQTGDLARVLRQPGTVNRKLDPVPVRLLEYHPERRYAPDDFRPYLLDPEALAEALKDAQERASDDDFQPAKWEPIFNGCAYLRHCCNEKDAKTLP